MTAQYQGVWSLQSAAQLQSTQRWVTDPLFENTTLLLQADDAANGAQNNTFLDSSSNNFAITRNGNTTQGSFTPFSQAPGYWGNYFDGTGDYITAAGANLALGTGNFTIEFWFYANAYSSAVDSAFMFDSRSGNNTSGFFIGPVFNNTQTLHVGQNTSPIITANTTYPLNTWVHCAVVRSSGTITLYQNGVNVGSVANTTNNTATTNYIGSGWWLPSGAGQMFNGYLSNLRISNTARYTANFNPSANVFVSDGNTVLLTCQSNRFVDGSSNGYTITVGGGTPSVQAFSPFAPQLQWTPSVIGGSGYFDGSSTLSLPLSANTSIASIAGKQLTFEFWINTSEIAAITAFNMGFYGNFVSAVVNGRYGIFLLGSSTTSPQTVQFAWTTSGSTTAGVSATTQLIQKAWNHVAITVNATTASNTTIVIYINGVGQTFTGQNLSSQNVDPNYNFNIGETRDGNQSFRGFMGGFKISSGIQRTVNFTPPTTPFTSDANTIALLNYQNAGIYDGTMKNNLQTFGNAQVSTAVVKYGSGSMFFNGSSNAVAPSSALNAILTSDYTVEFWVYHTTTITAEQDYVLWDVTGSLGFGVTTTGVFVGRRATAIDLQSTATLVPNIWYHLAFTRANGVTRIFVNGVQVASGTITNSYAQAPVAVGGVSGFYFTGYMDDFRITKGIARYTANFIPPSVALPRQ